MEITINLEKNNLGRLSNREPFLLPDKLLLKFSHAGYNLENAFITLKNGSNFEKYKLQEPFEVAPDFLIAGNLNIRIEMYVGDEKVKQWDCLPIKIRETEMGVEIFDIVSRLEDEIAYLKNNSVEKKTFNDFLIKYNEFVEKHNELTETVHQIKENY